MSKSPTYTKRLTLLVIILPLMLTAQLPDYHLQLFDHSYGIKAGFLRKTVRDKQGFLWILFPRQVQRFDGRRIENFTLEPGLNGLLCDDKGRIWVHAPGKIFRFNPDSYAFDSIPLPDKNTGSAMPLFNNEGRIYLLTGNQLFLFDEGRQAFIPGPAIPVPRPYSTRVMSFGHGALFIAHGPNFYRYHLQQKKLDSLENRNGMVLFPVHEDSAALTTWNGTTYWYNFRRGTITQLYSPQSILGESTAFFSIRSLQPHGPGTFFMATNTGIYDYDARQQTFHKLQFFHNGRPISTNDYAYSMSADEEGYLWLCTIDGVARFSYTRPPVGLLRIRTTDSELPGGVDNVRRMLEDKDGNLWLATAFGFAQWNQRKRDWIFYLSAFNREDKLSFPSIRGLAYDGRYIILGPADKGVWLFDTHTSRYRRPNYDSSATDTLNKRDFIDAITTLHNGNHLVMGRDALYLLERETYLLRRLYNPAATENTNHAFQGSDGIVWLATMKGLHCLDSQANYLQRVTSPMLRAEVNAGFPLPDGRLLFSSVDGLFTARYNGGTPQVQKLTNFFDSLLVLSLFQDQKGLIWATTENGIYRFDPVTNKADLFDYSDNVQGYNFNGNSWLLTRKNYLFFGSANGINYIKPEAMQVNAEPLRLFITRVRYGPHNHSTYNFDEPLSFNYSDHTIEIDFSAPYFFNANKLKFRYQLEGFDNEWKYIGSVNTIRFSALPSGSFKLQLQASTNGKDWVNAANTLSLHIKPPYYQQWWFITASALLFALGIGLFIRSRNRKLHEKQEELEAEQAIAFFAARMYEHHEVDAILWDVARNCIGQLQFEDCVIYLLDEKRSLLVQKAAFGPKSPEEGHIESPIEIELGAGITGTVAATGQAEIISDTSRDPRYIVDDERRWSEIAVPILSGTKVLGVIDCEHSKKGFFTQKHLSILTTIASLCAHKIVRAKAQEEKMKAEQALMDTRQRMADAEMQALRAQMNPHFIFNCLNSINRYIVKSDQATASLYLTRFAKLIRLILDNSNSKTVTLASELEALRLYMEMESIRFEKKYNYVIEVDESISPDSIFVPPLIIQPYVENAIWHGLLHKDGEGHLHIRIRGRNEGLLECTVEDNGVGRAKARELKSKSASTKKSLGMRLTEDRLALLSQQAKQQARVTVVDLFNEQDEAAGTRVIIDIPVE